MHGMFGGGDRNSESAVRVCIHVLWVLPQNEFDRKSLILLTLQQNTEEDSTHPPIELEGREEI